MELLISIRVRLFVCPIPPSIIGEQILYAELFVFETDNDKFQATLGSQGCHLILKRMFYS